MRRGLSQGDAAALVGIDQSAWSRVERGLQQPRAETLLVIAREFDLSLEQLLAAFADRAATDRAA